MIQRNGKGRVAVLTRRGAPDEQRLIDREGAIC
jgi:hypothetical protein